MKILLDTNFILTCAKQKVDFPSIANELVDEEIEWLIPQDVLNELGNIKNRTGIKTADKNAAKLSFEIIQTINPKIIELKGKNPNVDIKIVNYLREQEVDKKPGFLILATLDKDLKQRVKNKILTIRNKNHLELI